MSTNKRITDLTDYKSVLPYASEMFGVYQPLIGWKSKRIVKRMNKGITFDNLSKFKSILSRYKGVVSTNFDGCVIELDSYQVGIENDTFLKPQSESVLLSTIANLLEKFNKIPENEGWLDFINHDFLKKLLNEEVFKSYQGLYRQQCANIEESHHGAQLVNLQSEVIQGLKTESAIAGALLGYAENKLFEKLKSIFFISNDLSKTPLKDIFVSLKQNDYKDPYLTFDPKKDIKDVSLSPVGIVHLYRQFFFELDTFLGTPVSHVWLSPGSSVELIETSSRKTITEKTFETSLETTTKTEKSTTEEDEISKAVKQDNKDDTKLGFTTTVNQSWGTGNASATGSLNMDSTQQVAREYTEKHSKQQTEKLSSEIRQNFKSTFKTITDITDTTSKRYVLNNTTPNLINYELRRKMRQVGVQIQDIGSYLCWETFVDEPGEQLGLPNLIHIAQPADLILVPNPKLMPMPPLNLNVGFTGEMEWFFPENQRQYNSPDGFYKMNALNIPPIPDGYEIDNKGAVINISQEVIVMEDDDSEFFKNIGAKGKINNDGLHIEVGLILGAEGLAWDEGRIRFKVSGSVSCKLSDTKKNEINTANDALISSKLAADNENQRKQEEAYRKTAQERITLASKIKKRKFEDLREEERTIVYRNLIKSLMTENNYKNILDTPSGFETRHVLSELINSIFDINKMLYFVAPEWWKPRKHNKLSIGDATITNSINGSVVNWADQQNRPDNYFITENSEAAPLGSSLGWLLQLDGDDLRNAFLNAPWVKAVIPIRPGKEKAAMAWLQNVGVEGSDGLDAAYSAPDDELIRINVYLNTGKTPRQFTDAEWTIVSEDTAPTAVTIKQAIDFLCAEVAFKEEVSKTVSKYPKEEINDDNKVLATPLEKVYEHGFYPLKGGFKAIVEDHFEIISQWIEVLPTDQVVPVEVKYNPKTGRMLP
ncbi:hypothetical protein [Methylobacter sp.]|uniref:hypothetical protein n=1 Tax=Methylobacter sp. TaxID=2051955 RepID=UPI003DA59AEB